MHIANSEQPLRKKRGIALRSIVELKWNPKKNKPANEQLKRGKE